MKFWIYLLGGFLLFLGLFWLLAMAVGFLQNFLWIAIFGAVAVGLVGYFLRRRSLSEPNTGKIGFRERGKPERELKRMEKQQAREKAR